MIVTSRIILTRIITSRIILIMFINSDETPRGKEMSVSVLLSSVVRQV